MAGAKVFSQDGSHRLAGSFLNVYVCQHGCQLWNRVLEVNVSKRSTTFGSLDWLEKYQEIRTSSIWS